MNDLTGTDAMKIPAAPPRKAARYEDFYPYYAELSALTELRKHPGFSVPLASGVGGHLLFYLNGVRQDRSAGYPVLRLCTAQEDPAVHGAGVAVNSHYANANWIAVEGRDFLWRGALQPGERLSREVYERTQETAKTNGCLDGVIFQKRFFSDKPAGMSDHSFMYELSIATDYGVQFGRDSYRARVPLDRARMGALVDYLNAINAPYRAGKIYDWNIFNNNCVHVVHNALAAAGLWAPRKIGQWAAIAAWNFPVPKNAFVDVMRRASELPLDDAQALYEDAHIRQSLPATGLLPTAPGALIRMVRAITNNDLYDVAGLQSIFFDNAVWGTYRGDFARMFASPHHTDLRANFQHFATRYAQAQTAKRGRWLRGERAAFQNHYENHIIGAAQTLKKQLARLEAA
jgi:hypothetical protein